MTLLDLRAQLDALDSELLHLLARRAQLVEEVWAWKRQQQMPRIDAARESELKTRLLNQAEQLGLSRKAVAPILDHIIGQQLLVRPLK